MIERKALKDLQNWLKMPNRKPLVLRGARQVGKTWLVRCFADRSQKKLIELNFEKNPQHASLFSSNEPRKVIFNLEVALNIKIDLQHSLLFLDEIQASPEILAKLRWFAEELPELPVIAAGSLLEFVLNQHTFSMPVGRISYMHLEPLSFDEFLMGCKKDLHLELLKNFNLKSKNNEIPHVIHEQLMAIFREYLFIGGLPAVTNNWIMSHSLTQVNQIQHDLLSTYRDDFSKYKGRLSLDKLEEVFMAVPKMLGRKFMFSHVSSTLQSSTAKQILLLLDRARVCHPVWSVAANGVPLGAEIREKYFKEIFLDTGLSCAALRINYAHIKEFSEINLINQGAIAEQVVGQMLRVLEPYYVEPKLYYWTREGAQSNAEIDYVIQYNGRVVPIEVKAGSTGSLKSLHLFMGLKKPGKIAVRVNSDFPSCVDVQTKDHLGNAIEYTLISIPFYLVGELHRLLLPFQ